jgi:ribosomal protein S18 acetylase RimI-like enzyme
MIIRKLHIKEKEQILELGKKIFREEDEIPLLRKALLICSTELSYIAVDNGKIVGFALVCSKTHTKYYFDFMKNIPNCYELAFLGICPSAQGKGLGTRLLKETLEAIFQLSSRPFTCWLLVDIINEGAIKLYEKFGFRRWCKTIPPLTELPGYIMGIHSRKLIKNSYQYKHL